MIFMIEMEELEMQWFGVGVVKIWRCGFGWDGRVCGFGKDVLEMEEGL